MGPGGVTPPTSPPPPPKGKPEAAAQGGGGGNGGGVVSKVESGHFIGKGVADIRLRIAHSVEDTGEELKPPGDGPVKAYEKFLEQYRPPPPEDPAPEPESVIVPPPEPDPVIVAPPEPDPVIVPPPEPDPVIVPPPEPDPEDPVDEGGGALESFGELLDEALEEEPEPFAILA